MATKYVGPIRRRNYGKGHGYVDANGERMPGVTTILGDGLPKSALVNWAGKATASYALDHWDELGDMAPSVRLKKLEGARYEDRDTAAKRGTEVHGLGEKLVKGEEVQVPDELRGHIDAYIEFLDAFQVSAVLVEFVIASYRYGYAGTSDLIADLWDPEEERFVRWLLDLKTTRSGIFGETALQLAAYRHADVYIDADGNEQPMIEVERTGAVHIRADGYDLIPTISEEAQLTTFRYVQQIKKFSDESRSLIAPPLTPPDRRGSLGRIVYDN